MLINLYWCQWFVLRLGPTVGAYSVALKSGATDLGGVDVHTSQSLVEESTKGAYTGSLQSKAIDLGCVNVRTCLACLYEI